jgi:hypothetical protein
MIGASFPRAAQPAVVLYRWVCRCRSGKPTRWNLSPAPVAGLFLWPPRGVQPTVRLGVGVVGLRFGEIGKPVMAINMTHLAPLPCGAFVWRAWTKPSFALPLDILSQNRATWRDYETHPQTMGSHRH